MEKNNKKLLMRCVGYGVIALLAIFIIIGGYVYTVVSELQLKIDQTRLTKQAQQLRPSSLEKDSQVKKSDLETYLLFSENIHPVKSFKDLFELQKLIIERDRVQVVETTELPNLESNSCQKFNCIQIKKEFSDIPSSIWKGLLGTEDFRFLEHRGVDIWAIGRAIIVDLVAMKFIQGGSTLTQQLMKNLFLTNERKLSRKFKEMIYAVYIENILEKEEIITLYVNEMFWGVHQGVYIKGFYAASLAYFNKPPKLLDDFEATLLISLLKGPAYYNPAKNSERIKDRTTAVYKRLQGLNLVSNREGVEWSGKTWEDFFKDYQKRNAESDFNIYYLLSKNTDLYLEPFEKLVLFSSYQIHRKRLKARSKDADTAVKILIADVNCESYDCKELFSFYSKLEREKRKAIVGEFHQVGSLLKPIVYDSFIDLGRSYSEVVSTKPITLELNSGKWTPKDYSKTKVDEITLKEALQKSKNIPLIRIASEVGFEELENILKKRIPRMRTPLAEYPAQLLGALELSLEEVFSTYREFLREKCFAVGRDRVDFEDSILNYMSQADKTTISKLAKSPFKNALVFGKTGTSNKGLDNWFFAYDGVQIYLFYYGVESERDEQDLRLSGGVSAFLMFQDFINYRGKQISEIYCGASR